MTIRLMAIAVFSTMLLTGCSGATSSSLAGTVLPDSAAADLSLTPRDRELREAQRRMMAADDELLGVCRATGVGGSERFDLFVTPAGFEHAFNPGIDIPTRKVVVSGRFRALAAQMGASTSSGASATCHAGTLGIAAQLRADPRITGYITNNHVAASSGNGPCPNATKAKQHAPASLDSPKCKAGAEIGELHSREALLPLSTANHVDGAFVQAGNVDPATTCGICLQRAESGIVPPDSALNLDVQMCARSGQAQPKYGTVSGYHCAVRVEYACVPGNIRFEEQLRVAGMGFGVPGDSGAVVYGRVHGGIIGLLFAGDEKDIAFMNPMQEVVDALKVDPLPPICP